MANSLMRRIHCWQDSGNFKAEIKGVKEEQIIKDYGSYSGMVDGIGITLEHLQDMQAQA